MNDDLDAVFANTGSSLPTPSGRLHEDNNDPFDLFGELGTSSQPPVATAPDLLTDPSGRIQSIA